MNTIQFLIDEGVFAQYTTNFIRDIGDKSINHKFTRAFTDIDEAFVWGDTAEGYIFWADLHGKNRTNEKIPG